MQENTTGPIARVHVTGTGVGVTGKAGTHLLGRVANRIGIHDGLSAVMDGTTVRSTARRRGTVLTQLSMMIAGGGRCLSDLKTLRDQPALFGDVASDATAWRTINNDCDDVRLDMIPGVRQAAIRRLLDRAGLAEQDEVVLDVDATLLHLSDDTKEGAAPTFKRGFGFAPMLCFIEPFGLPAGMLRPGNHTANNAADHLAVVDQAIASLPEVFQTGHRPGDRPDQVQRRVIVGTDTAGGTTKTIRGLADRNIVFSVGLRSSQARAAVMVRIHQMDLAAMASLLMQGGGQPPRRRSDAVAVQAIWVAHRGRQVTARTALSNQVQGLVDQVFPTLADCYATLLSARSARVIIANLCDPDRIARLGAKRLRVYVANRGVAMTRPKADQVVAAAKVSLRLPPADRTALQTILAAEIGRYDQLCVAADDAERELASVLGDTPAAVLTSLPGVATIRASAYGAALGDPARYPNATAAYRTAGLAPAQHSSAGSSAEGQPISREGRRELRTAIVELGKGLARFEPDFADYRAALVARHKPRKVVNIAVGRRAHRLAFAMMRDQSVFDPHVWRAGVAAGRTVMDGTWPARYDVAAPPDTSMTDHDQEHNQNRQLVGA